MTDSWLSYLSCMSLHLLQSHYALTVSLFLLGYAHTASLDAQFQLFFGGFATAVRSDPLAKWLKATRMSRRALMSHSSALLWPPPSMEPF